MRSSTLLIRDGSAAELPLLLTRLLGFQVPGAALAPLDLSCLGHPDPLTYALMCLVSHLSHFLFWNKHHTHSTPLRTGRLLDLGNLLHPASEVQKDITSHVLMHDFSAPH